MGVAGSRAFDNGKFIVSLLGTLWDMWFPDKDTVVGIMTARGEPFWQVYLDLLDLVACKSRLNIPIFQRRYWHLFTVLESQKDSGVQVCNLYDTTGLTYQNANKPAYGDKENSRFFSYAIDAEIKDVHAVYNRVIDPSLIWMNNADFAVDADRGIISFYTDPFENALVPKRDVLDSTGTVVDREIALWLNFSSVDLQYVYEQFGYALGIWMESSTFYKDFISAIWDSLVLGPSQTSLKFAFAALAGIPFAKETETVVTIIDESPVYKHVETDKNIYTFKASATVIVDIGQELTIGDPMVSDLLFFEPTASLTAFPGIAIDTNLMRSIGLSGPIVFDNDDMTVDYIGLDINDKAIVQFGVSGFPADVTKFWANVHKEGVLKGVTMADALDTRAVLISPTTQADLPATVNPFNFAISHIFLNNMYLVYVNPLAFADGAPGLGSLDMLYPFLSPHTTYVIFVAIQQDTDYYTVGDQSDGLDFFKGTTISERADNFAVDIGPTIRAIPGRCR